MRASTRADSLKMTFADTVAIPHGGWIAARVIGPSSRYIGDGYVFAQTSPVYVVRGGHQYVSREDAKFLGDAVDSLAHRVERAPWRSQAEHDRFDAELARARAVYRRLETDGQ